MSYVDRRDRDYACPEVCGSLAVVGIGDLFVHFVFLKSRFGLPVFVEACAPGAKLSGDSRVLARQSPFSLGRLMLVWGVP